MRASSTRLGTQSVSLPTEAEVRSRAIRHESEKELKEPLVLCFQYSTALPDLKLSVCLSTAYRLPIRLCSVMMLQLVAMTRHLA